MKEGIVGNVAMERKMQTCRVDWRPQSRECQSRKERSEGAPKAWGRFRWELPEDSRKKVLGVMDDSRYFNYENNLQKDRADRETLRK